MTIFGKKQRSFEELVKYRNALLMRVSVPQQKLYSYLSELGFPFYPEAIVKPYIVDAIGLYHAVAFEVDGYQHDEAEEYDDRRSAFLAKHGIEVFRIPAKEVTKELVMHYVLQAPFIGLSQMNELVNKINGFEA